MALVKCSECGNAISNTAKTCPHCGHKNKKRSSFGKLVGVSILGLFAVMIVFAAFNPDGGGSPPPPPQTPEQLAAEQKKRLDRDRAANARIVAEREIRALLKAPRGAKFSGYRETEVGYLNGGGPNEVIVKGYVDAQNSFGAMIRNRYEVILEFQEGKSDRARTKSAGFID